MTDEAPAPFPGASNAIYTGAIAGVVLSALIVWLVGFANVPLSAYVAAVAGAVLTAGAIAFLQRRK